MADAVERVAERATLDAAWKSLVDRDAEPPRLPVWTSTQQAPWLAKGLLPTTVRDGF